MNDQKKYTPTEEEKKRFEAEFAAYLSIMGKRKAVADAVEKMHQSAQPEAENPGIKFVLDSEHLNPLYG